MTITPVPMIYAALFTDPNPSESTLQSYLASASDLAGSGFATVNLWQFHVSPAGDLLINAAPPIPPAVPMISGGSLQSAFSYVPQVLGTLTGSGSKVTTVRATIGGWGLNNTFNCMVQLINQYGTGPANPLYQNLAALKALGIASIDLDLEPSGGAGNYDYTYFLGPLAQLITMAAAVGLDTTFCPYENENFWLVLLAAAYAENGGTQPVKSMNVQCYAGGQGNRQRKWIHRMRKFHKLDITLTPRTMEDMFGISDPAAFMVPGLGMKKNGQLQCPAELKKQLTRCCFAEKGITGAYLFAYGGIQTIQQDGSCPQGATTADFANALIEGINEINSRWW